MERDDAKMANELLEKSKEPNVVQALVGVEKLHTRNVQRRVQLDADQLLDFSVLTLEFLKKVTVGVYQVKLAPSYVQDKL